MTTLAILGDINLDFVTHRELRAELARIPSAIEIDWIETDAPNAFTRATQADGLWLIPGTPYKLDAPVFAAITHARTSHQPFLGTCGGFQYALVEYAREVADIEHAQHGEVAPDAESQIVTRLSCSLVDAEREVSPVAGTRLADMCGTKPFVGYHYCNFGLSPEFVERLSSANLVFNAFAEDAGVEGFELPEHPFYIATLFQPQVGALANKPQHALVSAFLNAVQTSTSTK